MKETDPLKEKSFKFAVRIYNLQQYLVEQRKEFILSKQVLRSGTNPGAMLREAAFAESGTDFIHKLSIAQKELNETEYWLELMLAVGLIEEKAFLSLQEDLIELKKMLKSSILTRKKNLAKKGGAILTLVLLLALGIYQQPALTHFLNGVIPLIIPSFHH